MATLTIEEARNAAILAHPEWRSADIERLAQGMVGTSEKLALLDQLEREVTEFDTAEAERHDEWKAANPDGSLLGVPGGIGWGSQSARDDANMADLFERSERAAEAGSGTRQHGHRSPPVFDYDDIVKDWQAKDRALRAGPKKDTGPRPATAADARPATIEDAFEDLPDHW